jgi:serine/threonine protein kinase/Tol biopolymer transport system component
MLEGIEQAQRAFTSYTVERELGSGGMATVYLAHDKKHDRHVAIKILHAELAAMLGPERFLREIRVTANLQHPHILGLIDSGVIGEEGGKLNGRPYYVMPYVDGESLRQRLDNEHQLPIPDAVRIATEVASALDYAHRHGVVHRDIKPENILLHDGSAVVADFGIALAVTQAGGERMTQSGISLGTPTYMSPEQAMGERAVTPRSDIYSLGAVTYEMLAGEPPFRGATAQAVVAKVMTEEPKPLTAQRRSVPPHVSAAVSHALEKVPADRFASAHEFAEALNNPSSVSAAPPRAVLDARNRNPMLIGAASIAVLLLGVTIWALTRPRASNAVVRYNIAFDSAEALTPDAPYWGRIDLSPDGSRIAYLGGPQRQIFIRARNQLHATALAGTEGAMTPAFSPDGQQIAFQTFKNIPDLRIVPVSGGPPIIVTDSMVSVAGMSWGRDGYIYSDGPGPAPLSRVEAKQGAVPKWFTVLDTAKGEVDHTWPDVLPNAKGVVFSVKFIAKGGQSQRVKFAIAVAEIPSGKHHVILNDALSARYSPSGHLLYVTANKTLMIVPFDQNAMRITGEATPLVQGVRVGPFGSTDVVVASNGTLMYGTNAERLNRELIWVTRDGKVQSADPDWGGGFIGPALSRDGKELAVSVRRSAEASDIWIKHLDSGSKFKLTLEGLDNFGVGWTPDSKQVTYASRTAGFFGIWTKRADGSGPALPVVAVKSDLFNPTWSADGKWVVFQTSQGDPGIGDIEGIRPGVDTAPVALVATKYTESLPDISPDGHWLAYSSNESGQYEIYVVPFPNTRAGKWMVSTRGGLEPYWSHRGNEIFYRDSGGNFMTVQVRTNPTFSIGRATPLFSVLGYVSDFDRCSVAEFDRCYAVSADDRRFLMIRPQAVSGFDQLVVADNWFEELKGKR